MLQRQAILKSLLAEVEKIAISSHRFTPIGVSILTPEKMYANFNPTLVDDTHIYIGDYGVWMTQRHYFNSGHPEPEWRKKSAQFNVAINIKNNVWIGANAVILPGITIGENSVIGAGSIVTKDIPANVVAFGNPCRVVRAISDHDREYYYKDLRFKQD